MNTLCLRFEPEDEWHGQLFASLKTQQFAGAASAWFGTDEVRRFATDLIAYPIRSGAPPSIAGGYFSDEPDTSQPEHVHLGIDVMPHDLQGRLRITVRLATETCNAENTDLGYNATVRFLATYGDVGTFAAAITSLIEGRVDEAMLSSTAD